MSLRALSGRKGRAGRAIATDRIIADPVSARSEKLGKSVGARFDSMSMRVRPYPFVLLGDQVASGEVARLDGRIVRAANSGVAVGGLVRWASAYHMTTFGET